MIVMMVIYIRVILLADNGISIDKDNMNIRFKKVVLSICASYFRIIFTLYTCILYFLFLFVHYEISCNLYSFHFCFSVHPCCFLELLIVYSASFNLRVLILSHFCASSNHLFRILFVYFYCLYLVFVFSAL